MQLYFSPGACSLSPHIALREAGLPVELVRVDTASHKTESGDDFYAINDKGYVPTLRLPDGSVLTEGAAIVQWIADQKPAAHLAPANGTADRYHLQEWLNFIASEIHKGYSPLFNKVGSDESKKAARDKLATRLALVDKKLAGKPYLLGEHFSVADGYLFTVLRWSGFTHVDLSPYANIAAFVARVAARPHVQEALKAEGLAK